MDSISHALYRAVKNEQALALAEQAERGLETLAKGSFDACRPKHPGLRAFAQDKAFWDAYSGAAGTDLFIELPPGEEVTCLWTEFTSSGLRPPVGMLLGGCFVILSPGHIEVQVSEDSAEPGTWVGMLVHVKGTDRHGNDFNRAQWTEQNV